ncbi:unnamed protein product [Sphenostylis stenocarpa]|uniref:Uncharacterized protein n=1 Tax=Sphenostylis stenocarpa TaxID=92480 RepID=A0AA86S8T4_9FABA|nr:unnamed protein product [Sphenostylis stenocarpa]
MARKKEEERCAVRVNACLALIGGVMEWRVGDGEETGWVDGVNKREMDRWDPLICCGEIFV